MRYEVRTSIQNWCNRNHIETIGKSGNSKLHLNTGGTNKLGYKNIEMHLAVNQHLEVFNSKNGTCGFGSQGKKRNS